MRTGNGYCNRKWLAQAKPFTKPVCDSADKTYKHSAECDNRIDSVADHKATNDVGDERNKECRHSAEKYSRKDNRQTFKTNSEGIADIDSEVFAENNAECRQYCANHH